jgi:anti-sigma factor RsiW
MKDPACRDVQSALPWYANGQLPEAECATLSAHLRECAACRAELAEEEHLQVALADTGPVELAPQAAMRRFFARLDSLETNATPDPADAPLRARARWLRRVPPGARGLLVAVQALAFIAAGAWLEGRLSARAPAAAYVTESAPRTVAAGPRLRVVAKEQAPLGEFEALLGRLGAEIVAGPSEARVYTLALPAQLTADQLQARLAAARADPSVTFAEPVAPSGGH